MLKQERRGGIETAVAARHPGGEIGKQERRGGIETWMEEVLGPPLPVEAGTPWWH